MVGKQFAALLGSPLLVAGFPHIAEMLEKQKMQERKAITPIHFRCVTITDTNTRRPGWRPCCRPLP